MVRDTWRAILVIAVVLALRHEDALWRAIRRAAAPEPPSVETGVVWQPPPPVVWVQPPQPVTQRGPLRQIGSAGVDFAEALIGVVRR